MKNFFLFVIFISISMFIIFKYNDYNLRRTIDACVATQKIANENESFDIIKAREFCTKEIKKQKSK